MPPDACLNEETIALLVEGSLGPGELATAEAHLATCDACLALVGDVGNAVTADLPPEPEGARPLGPGAQVGRYQVLRAIGEGAMGRVYAAHDPALDRNVALKLLHPHLATADLEARLFREAKTMAKLSHPEVITVHDAGKHGDQLFLAMELIDGGTLRQWLAAKPRTWREVLAVYVRAGRGLAQAHAAGIIHRDFKPDNVLVGTDGRVRVTDFGLARAVAPDGGVPESRRDGGNAKPGAPDEATLTQTGMLLGTPAYMAPGQLMGEPADVRSDIYGFSVALYEGLYGERPFAATLFRELHRERAIGAVRPAPANHSVPARLRRALLVALKPAPADRYASMDVMLAALDAAVESRRPLAVVGVAALFLGASIAFAMHRPHAPVAPIVASPAPAKASCTSEACGAAHPGEAWVCRAADGACVSVTSPDCVATFAPGDLRDDTVWLGAMFPTKGPNAAVFGTMHAQGAELARDEIAAATGPLAGSGASMHVRRIALVTCDDSQDPMRAARHLVDDVGVPAILGFSSGKEIEDVAGSLLIKRGVVTVATLSASPLITRLPQPPDLPRMVWRTTFSLDSLAEATAHFVHETIEHRTRRGSEKMRIAFVRPDGRAGTWFGEALYKDLAFNDKAAVDNGSDYQEIILASPPSPHDTETAADRIVAVAPSIVVLYEEGETAEAIVARAESRWPAGARRATWIVPDDVIDHLLSVAPKGHDARHRLFGVLSPPSQTPNARFTMRFDAVHPNVVTRELNPGVTYDAFYALAYAAFANGDAQVTGPSLARAFARLVPPGPSIEVGPSGVLDALTTLGRGEHVDLVGTESALDFNLATGDAPFDFTLTCAGPSLAGTPTRAVESGLVYEARTRAVAGAIRCP